MEKIFIKGGKKLKGTMLASGSKNAALPIIAACLLTKEVSVLHNVPNISDIKTLLDILKYLNVKSSFKGDTLTIDPQNIKNVQIPIHLVEKMRASIILLAPLLVLFSEVKLAFPGGCYLGKRPIDAHLEAFKALGAEIVEQAEFIHLKAKKLKANNFAMSEMSVTATENAIQAACLAKGMSVIELCAAEPHVQDLCQALNQAGAKISGIGTHTLTIQGVKNITALNHTITSDYLEVGTYAIACAVTAGHIVIKNAVESHLTSFWQKMAEAKVRFEHRKNEVEIFPSPALQAVKVRTAVFPSFPTDLQAPFAVLLTQAKGNGRIFETLFEGKMNYIFELEKMGAHVTYINNHEVSIFGKTKLQGCPVASLDIRAGATMILAALCAEGETEISQINYIERGYSDLVEKFSLLGADIRKK